MRNWAELAWVLCAVCAIAFATFMLAFGLIAFSYWLIALAGIGV